MRRRATRRLLAAGFVCAAAGARPCAAQVEAGLDAAAAVVAYDGYLASAAAALTPSLAWRSPRTTLAARGTLLAFESGNTSLQGLLSAATFSAPAGPLRVEIAGEVGASTYASVAQFAHALGRVRAHVLGGRWGLWVGPLAGAVGRSDGEGGALGISAGWWGRGPAGALEVTWTSIALRDTTYSDLEGQLQWRRGGFAIDLSAGARTASHRIGAAAYGDVSAAMQIARNLEIVVGAGSYPGDPVSGTIPGRFVMAGVRLWPRPTLHPALAREIEQPHPADSVESPARLEGARVAVERLDDLVILTIRAAGARRVEVMGDFTDWQPVVLPSTGDGRYRYALGLTTGMYRYNVRLDGGPWGVPQGAGLAADEFGGNVGVLVVP